MSRDSPEMLTKSQMLAGLCGREDTYSEQEFKEGHRKGRTRQLGG